MCNLDMNVDCKQQKKCFFQKISTNFLTFKSVLVTWEIFLFDAMSIGGRGRGCKNITNLLTLLVANIGQGSYFLRE